MQESSSSSNLFYPLLDISPSDGTPLPQRSSHSGTRLPQQSSNNFYLYKLHTNNCPDQKQLSVNHGNNYPGHRTEKRRCWRQNHSTSINPVVDRYIYNLTVNLLPGTAYMRKKLRVLKQGIFTTYDTINQQHITKTT